MSTIGPLNANWGNSILTLGGRYLGFGHCGGTLYVDRRAVPTRRSLDRGSAAEGDIIALSVIESGEMLRDGPIGRGVEFIGGVDPVLPMGVGDDHAGRSLRRGSGDCGDNRGVIRTQQTT